MTEALRILIVENHPMYVDGLTGLIESVPGFELAARATDGRDGVDKALETQPDVVLMDLAMPGMDGIEATERIVAASPTIAVLVLTMLDDDDSVFLALRAGARGYLLKDAERPQIVRAIEAIARGEAVFGPEVAHRVLGYFAETRRDPVSQAVAFPELTEREREILGLVAAGLDNAEISRRLVVSTKTIRNHVSNIFAKLHVAHRAQAIVKAREAGLGVAPGGERRRR